MERRAAPAPHRRHPGARAARRPAPITQTQWWHPRHTASPAHAWIRARIAEIAAELDQTDTVPSIAEV
jgi:hypothetical protein